MSEMPTPVDDLVVIGKIVSVCGIRGEVGMYSSTDPLDNLLDYRHWALRRNDEIRQTELVRGHLYGKVLAAKSKGLGDREETRIFTGYEIYIPRNGLLSLEESEYHWHQLEGLKAVDQGGQLLDVINHLLEAGANGVMVVKPCAGSLNDRECLLPYTGQCVLSIDLVAGEIRVDWGAGF